MIKPPVTKTIKIVDSNITNFQTSSLNYIFVPISSKAVMPQGFANEISKKWMNVDLDLRTWKAYPRLFVSGKCRFKFVQTNAVIIFAYCLNDDGSIDEKAMASCAKEAVKKIKGSSGCVNFSKSLEIPDLVNFVETNFLSSNITCYIFN